MFKIVNKKMLNPTVCEMDIEAPLVARKADAGQFIILRVDEEGERIPLTVAGYDREAGTVKIIFQIVGATTELLNHKEEGEYIQDFVGRRYSRTCCHTCTGNGNLVEAFGHFGAELYKQFTLDIIIVSIYYCFVVQARHIVGNVIIGTGSCKKNCQKQYIQKSIFHIHFKSY